MPAGREPGQRAKRLKFELRYPSPEWIDRVTEAAKALGHASTSDYVRELVERGMRDDGYPIKNEGRT